MACLPPFVIVSSQQPFRARLALFMKKRASRTGGASVDRIPMGIWIPENSEPAGVNQKMHSDLLVIQTYPMYFRFTVIANQRKEKEHGNPM